MRHEGMKKMVEGFAGDGGRGERRVEGSLSAQVQHGNS